MSEYTRGPWEASKNVPASGHTYEVWTVYPPIPPGERVMGAVAEVYRGELDARLIAAAPELLEAAKEVRTWLIALDMSDDEVQHMKNVLRAAIAKAEGRE